MWDRGSSRAIGAVVARLPDTEEVTGSNPVSPTVNMQVRGPFEGLFPFSGNIREQGSAATGSPSCAFPLPRCSSSLQLLEEADKVR